MLQKKLHHLECQRGTSATLEDIQCTRIELSKLLDIEEVMWHQRSHINWLQHGDKNMSFFHTKASSRYQRNTIQGIQNGAGIWQEEEEEIGRVFVEYYESLTVQWLPGIRSWQCIEADVPYHSPGARWDAPRVLLEILVNCKSCIHQHYLEFFKFRCLPITLI